MKEKENHVWEGLKRSQRQLTYTMDQITQMTKDFEIGNSQIKLLKELPINEYTIIASLSPSSKDTPLFQEYLSRLRELGIDVGKGDAQYGFKMPIPKETDIERELIIFRRK